MSSPETDSRGPPDLSPREAVERYLQKTSVDRSASTIKTYRYRLKLFVEWCESKGIDSIRNLSGWDLESFEAHRRGKDVAPITLQNELNTLQLFLEYCERIELVDDGLAERIDPPVLSKSEESSDVRLDPTSAIELIRHFRGDPKHRGKRHHFILELCWFTGARMGAIRALDLRDVDLEGEHAHFVHRPETDTPLKNGVEGERYVVLPTETCSVVDRYITQFRNEVRDAHDRQPLLTSQIGRPATTTLRNWTYFGTLPCHAGPCPHDKNPDSCEWFEYHEAFGCPSSRSPHRIRTGAITWMLNQGIPKEVVADRVNASIEVIDRHYDKEEPLTELDERRRMYVDRLGIDESAENSQETNESDDTNP